VERHKVKQGRDLQPLGWPLTRLALVLALGAIAALPFTPWPASFTSGCRRSSG
jgi:hypothetical protein